MTSRGPHLPGWARPAVILCAAVVAVATTLVVLEAAPLLAADRTLSEAAHEYGATRPDWVATLSVLTWLGSGWVLMPIGFAVAAILLWRKRTAAALVVLVGLSASQATQWLLKALVARDRPPDPLGYAGWYGFASGHSQNAATAALLLAVVLWPVVGRAGRITAVLVAAAWAGLVGFTRVALVVHWPSDVLAGWALGGLMVATAVVLVRKLAAADPEAAPARTDVHAGSRS